jgi:hypothetical protein
MTVDFGFWPAVLVHDYGNTLIIVAWPIAFTTFAHRWVLGSHMHCNAQAAVA